MSVRKRGESWIADVVFEHADGTVTRRTKTSPVNTRRGAEEYERQLRADLLAGPSVPAIVPPTLEEFREKVLTRARLENKPSWVHSKTRIFKAYLTPEFGDSRLDAIDAEWVDSFKAGLLEQEFSPKTINNILTVLRTTLELAVEYKRLAAMPPGKFWLRVPKQGFDFLTFDEAARLLASADPEWRPLLAVALNTGLRKGELQGLQWDAVDLVAGRLRVFRSRWNKVLGDTKTHREREVPLNEKATAALRGCLESKLRGPYVFSYPANTRGNECKGHPLHNDSMRNGILRCARLAGLRPIGWHVLRHTFASHLVMRGRSLKEVQELLGHTSMEMTLRYAHLAPEVKADAVRALDYVQGATSHG